ncbi:hypothetical protein [Photobacterium alginatilyticum]|uniref:Thrombospondin n=1 Tax=Photobacterium alginatilyticum TaxID=1775171 RepID=A0ABW9YGT0_9GAMM|nr:hypothetical protein [Photobacterium alginatilyticum]NBI52980.1 hypothetical protein [Photobacterium alginatilyticum]
MMKQHPLAIAVGLGTLLMLAGCNDDSSNNTAAETPQPNPQPQTTMSVTAIDGYLNKATVWLDLDRDYQLDANEPNVKSGDKGLAELDVTGIDNPEQYPIVVKAVTGETVDEDNPGVTVTKDFIMSAPAGSEVVSPLTTMVDMKVRSEGIPVEQAVEDVASMLGIEAELLTEDYGDNNPQIDTVAVKLVQQSAKSIVSAGVLPNNEDALNENNLVATLADVMNSGDEVGTALKSDRGDEVSDDYDFDRIVNENKNVESDKDKDGVADSEDKFPEDGTEWADTDGDGHGDNLADKFPQDSTEWADADGDNYGDNAADKFPDDPTEWADTDGDGHGDNFADVFPEDSTEWADSDGDNYGDNAADKFPEDSTEWADSDGDGYGDNLADRFPEDSTEWLDSDGDNVGDNRDSYPDNAEKSVADTTTTINNSGPVLISLLSDVRELNTSTTTVVETFNSGNISTTKTTTYSMVGSNRYFGKEEEVSDLSPAGDFVRTRGWEYDFNLDGIVGFRGKAFEQGSRTSQGETFWRYIDESSAQPEGGDNGADSRQFDNLDLVAQIAAKDLTGVDVIQHITQTNEQGESSEKNTQDIKQYSASGFDFDAEEYLPEYQYQMIATFSGGLLTGFEELRDWNADGLVNVSFQLTDVDAQNYTFAYQRPVWSNPHNADFEEYSHYTYVQGKAGELGPQWYEVNRQVSWQDGLKTVLLSGKRFLLDETDGRHQKRTDDDNPDGVLFSQYTTQTRDVSDSEKVESSSWASFALDDSYFGQDRENFTVLSDDMGQDYKIFQRLDNGMWLGHRFAEWGSQNIVDLSGQVEALRAANYELAQITPEQIPGLSNYDGKVLTPSFRIDDSGQPVVWHFITNNSAITGSDDGSYQLLSITLSDNGIKDGWLVNDNGVGTVVISVPVSDSPWDWYNAYWRMMVDIDSFNTNEGGNSYSWTSWLGEFYLDQAQATARALELGVGVKEYTVCTEGDTEWDDVNDVPATSHSYQEFVASATSCQYEAMTVSDIGGKAFYRTNSRGELRHWVLNADGTGQYFKNGYPNGQFTWAINSEGIVVIDYGNGDLDYFAYVSKDDTRISFKLYSEWNEDGQDLKEVWSSGFTYNRPEDYTVRSCKVDLATSNATMADFTTAIQSCGGHHVITEEDAAEIANIKFVRVRGDGDTRAYQFNADNSVAYYRAGENRESSTRRWERTDDGYLKITWDTANPEEYMILANLLYSDDQSSFVVYDVYQDDGQWVKEVWSLVFREYEGNKITECNEGNSPWNSELDQPSAFNVIDDYYAATESCRVRTDDQTLKFTEDMLVGKNDKSSIWALLNTEGTNEQGEPIYKEDERLRFDPNNKGAFVDAEDGEFGFDWQIDDGQLLLSITHQDYAGSTEKMSIVETDGEYFSVKTFWIDTSGEWANPAPAEGEGELTSLIFKQISKD